MSYYHGIICTLMMFNAPILCNYESEVIIRQPCTRAARLRPIFDISQLDDWYDKSQQLVTLIDMQIANGRPAVIAQDYTDGLPHFSDAQGLHRAVVGRKWPRTNNKEAMMQRKVLYYVQFSHETPFYYVGSLGDFYGEDAKKSDYMRLLFSTAYNNNKNQKLIAARCKRLRNYFVPKATHEVPKGSCISKIPVPSTSCPKGVKPFKD